MVSLPSLDRGPKAHDSHTGIMTPKRAAADVADTATSLKKVRKALDATRFVKNLAGELVPSMDTLD